jgi:hypothetical protein
MLLKNHSTAFSRAHSLILILHDYEQQPTLGQQQIKLPSRKTVNSSGMGRPVQ